MSAPTTDGTCPACGALWVRGRCGAGCPAPGAQPVDVLAVMDTLADGYLRNEGTAGAYVTTRSNTKPGDGTPVGDAWGRMREARAAVAELIEAAKPVVGGHRFVGNRDMNRLRAALARVGGAA